MTKNPGLLIVICGAAAAWQIYEVTTAVEAPSRAVIILHYMFLICLLLGVASAAYRLLRSQ
jgi:hypothetical protein